MCENSNKYMITYASDKLQDMLIVMIIPINKKLIIIHFSQEKLQQLVLLRSPDVVSIARDPQSGESGEFCISKQVWM